MDASVIYDRDLTTPKLNYVWVDPPKPAKAESQPFWANPEADGETSELIESLADYGWKTDYIRRQITRLKVKPKGRRRVDLLTQLVESFLQPDRILRQLDTLSNEEGRFYTYLLLDMNLRGLRTQPKPINQLVTFTKTVPTLKQRIIDAGLGLVGEDDEFFVPFETFRVLPARYIEFSSVPEPEHFIPAANPQLLLTHIQQLLNLIRTHTYNLRQQLRWSAPRSPYSQSNLVLPIRPDDAQRILNNPNFSGGITFYPQESLLDASTVDDWMASLGMSLDYVEFLYHLLAYTGIVLPGSPITVDEKLIQTWMMHAPGQQIVDAYHVYRSISSWSDWWPRWRDGHISIGWNYQNYWSFYGIDNTLAMFYYMQRWVILDVLAYLPHDVWLTIDSVSDFLAQLFPIPESQQYCHPNLLRKDERGHWKGFMRQVLLSMVEGPLHWMGFTDIAPGEKDVTMFRLHGFQDLHWNRVTALPVAETKPLARDDVQFAPGEALLYVRPPATAEFLNTVQRWTTPGGLSGNRLAFRLDVRRLYTTFEQGETPETLAEAWASGAPFPPLPEIAEWWQHWWDRYGHVRLYPAQATLMTRDEFTMQELQVALPTLRDAILGLITPRTALLHTDEVDRILRDLERQGYMPKEAS